jgi:hypothetical protein
MEAKERKNNRRAEATVKGDIKILGVDRKFRTVNRGFLVVGLVMAIIGLFMAPVTVRTLCILINRGGYVQDAFEIEFFNEGTSVTSQRLEGRIVSNGERFVTKRIDLVGGEQRRQLAAEGRIQGHHLPVWYLPRRGVWAGIDRFADFRLLSPTEFDMTPTLGVGFALFNIAFALGGALLVRREIQRALKELRSRELL